MQKVLIAEDNETTRRFLKHTLKSAGYDVVTARDGLEAWEKLQTEQDMSLAILDWMMPGMTGVEICQKLQEERKSSFVYVILVTAKEGVENLSAALAAGASDYITKPFENEELFARLKVGIRTVALQSQLVHAQKLEAIGQLASGIAHEINTPAQYVGDNARFLQESFVDINKVLTRLIELLGSHNHGPKETPALNELSEMLETLDVGYASEEIPKAIAESIEGIDHVSRIVRAMRQFAHPGLQEPEHTDINNAIESAITVTTGKWKYIAEMKTDLDRTLPEVLCLPAEFNQAILNLITNAADAIAEAHSEDATRKGTIAISTRQDNDWVEIKVADTGSGIPAAARGRIFDPFYTTKSVGQGSGQGLAIVHSIIVEKHGGDITFDTQTDRGTTFTVRLPIHPEVTAAVVEHSDETQG